MVKNIVITPGFLGRPEPIYSLSEIDIDESVATYGVGLTPKNKYTSLSKKYSFGEEYLRNSHLIEMWINEEHSGLAEISFSNYELGDGDDAEIFIATLDFVALDTKLRGKGVSSYLAEQCGYFAASAMLQHMLINNIKKCALIFTADFESDGGERFFFNMIEFTDQALNIGAKVSKLKYTLEAETDSLQWVFSSKGPRVKRESTK